MEKKIVITGINGFIGSYLAAYFYKKNFSIIGLTHTPRKESPYTQIAFELNKPFDETILRGAEILIHCAYQPHKSGVLNAFENNKEGTRHIVEAAREYGVKYVVFLSSYSAQDGALNQYGKAKYEAEKFFNPEKELILRLGLVLGNGGLFSNIIKIIATNKFVPLPAGGKQPLQILYINDLAKIIEYGYYNRIFGTFPIAHPDILSVKELNYKISKRINKKVIFINLPYLLIIPVCRFAELIKIKLPISTENILGLKTATTYYTNHISSVFNIQMLDVDGFMDLKYPK